jgi:hypothetical protein
MAGVSSARRSAERHLELGSKELPGVRENRPDVTLNVVVNWQQE